MAKKRKRTKMPAEAVEAAEAAAAAAAATSGSGSASGGGGSDSESGQSSSEAAPATFTKTGAIAAPLGALKAGGEYYLRALRERTRAGYRSAKDFGIPVETYATERQVAYIKQRDVVSSALAGESSSDDSDDDMHSRNTLGKIPLEWYDEMDHMGYDLDGKQIAKTGTGMDTIDDYIARTDDPEYWRRVFDEATQSNVTLTVKEMEMLRRMQKGKFADMEFDPYEDWEPFFSRTVMEHPVTNRLKPKSSFVPSKWEAKKVAQMVRKIRTGQIRSRGPPPPPEVFDIWADEDANAALRHATRLAAPRPALPGNVISYNPPLEYLKDHEGTEPLFSALRHVPAYDNALKDAFERCLDLAFCPRAKKTSSGVRMSRLLPKVPDPRELRPFPTKIGLVFKGHSSKVRSLSVHPTGQYLLSGSNDGSVRLWEVSTGRCLNKWVFDDDTVVYDVAWSPVAHTTACLFAATTGGSIYIVAPLEIAPPALTASTLALLSEGIDELPVEGTFKQDVIAHRGGVTAVVSESASESGSDSDDEDEDEGGDEGEPGAKEDSPPPLSNPEGHQESRTGRKRLGVARWEQAPASKVRRGVWLRVAMPAPVASVAWHAKGDYLASVSPNVRGRSAMHVHQLSTKKSQTPFAKSKDLVQRVKWHPSKPIMFIATRTAIKVYHLIERRLLRTLRPGATYISDIAVHPLGDHVLCGSFDKVAAWFDLDYSNKPYKKLAFHKYAVRSVAYSPKYPLFATCSDDNTIQIFHGRVYADLLASPLIVPVKILTGHTIVDDIGVIDVAWHPMQPWVFSAGADGHIHLYI